MTDCRAVKHSLVSPAVGYGLAPAIFSAVGVSLRLLNPGASR